VQGNEVGCPTYPRPSNISIWLYVWPIVKTAERPILHGKKDRRYTRVELRTNITVSLAAKNCKEEAANLVVTSKTDATGGVRWEIAQPQTKLAKFGVRWLSKPTAN
jgi:hypothetical protein